MKFYSRVNFAQVNLSMLVQNPTLEVAMAEKLLVWLDVAAKGDSMERKKSERISKAIVHWLGFVVILAQLYSLEKIRRLTIV